MSAYEGLNGNGKNGGPWWVRFVIQVGVPSAIALFLVWVLTTAIRGTVEATRMELRDHARDTVWYQRQACINLATMAGTSPALCEPPSDRNR